MTMAGKVSKKKKKTILIISGAIIVFLLVSGAYIIRQNSSQKESSFSNELPKTKNDSPLDQPNNPPPSPLSKPKEEDPTQERNTKIKQLISENEYLLKTNPQLVPIPDNYIGELLDKGYNQAGDMRKLFDLKLAVSDIPDLNSPQRIGVIKGLGIIINKEEEKNNPLSRFFQEQKGTCDDLVVVARETSADNWTSPQINIDRRIWNEAEQTYFREIIEAVLAQETNNPSKWEVSILYANAEGQFEGKSAGTALYLALLSAIHKKPLAKILASSGELVINEQKVLDVGGLKGKITAAFNRGVRSLVLPERNSLPSWEEGTILISPESYQQQVPPEIKEKMTVNWVGKCHQLRDLLLQNKLS